jgi:hypothetical protein
VVLYIYKYFVQYTNLGEKNPTSFGNQ